MVLYLVHHGDAVMPDVDPQRPLSAHGRAEVARVAAAAAARGARPEAVWHSGKLRARQTAEAFWKACNPLSELAARRGLQPTDPPEWARDLTAGETRDLMLVGHLPNLARLLRLLAGNEDASIDFPLHGIVALEAAGEGWTERWRIQ
jgi:phosphohistidine phosphatase